MPPEKDKASVEVLVERYWFVLKRRCAKVLESTTAAEEVARLALARLVGQLDQGAEANEWMETLYRDTTGPCLERLTGRKGRDTEWLGELERQAKAEKAEADRVRAGRDRLLELLDRTAPELRTPVLLRYLDGLGLDSVARLTGQTREEAQAKLERFRTKANELLNASGDPPLDATEPLDCPDDLAFDRLLAGEQEGLADTKAYLEAHPNCADRLHELEQARDRAATPEALGQAIEGVSRAVELLALTRAGPKRRRLSFGLPALAVALAIGLVWWTSLPDTIDPKDNPLVEQNGYSLEVFVAGDKNADALVNGETVHEGTELRFRLGAVAPMWVRLSALREQGPVIPIGPAERLTWALRPGELTVPPHRHSLGSGEGLERIFALFCPLGGPLVYFNQGLAYAFQPGLNGKRDLARTFTSAPRNCQLRSLILRRSANKPEHTK